MFVKFIKSARNVGQASLYTITIVTNLSEVYLPLPSHVFGAGSGSGRGVRTRDDGASQRRLALWCSSWAAAVGLFRILVVVVFTAVLLLFCDGRRARARERELLLGRVGHRRANKTATTANGGPGRTDGRTPGALI